MEDIKSKLILGLDGVRMGGEERRWFAASPPAGVILFARNVVDAAQVRALLTEAQDAAGQALWAAIDEEGGRVNRIPWSPFCDRPTAASYGVRFLTDQKGACAAAQADAERCGVALAGLGFTHNCAPVLDVFHPQADRVIGGRAYSADPAVVTALAQAVVAGFRAGGIEAVGKHFPGHGRANCDSHLETPSVDVDSGTLLAEAAPFANLIGSDLNHVMTAHVRFVRQDAEIASCSRYWLQQVLRQEFGFIGSIWSDDLSMGGAGDDLAAALRGAAKAGCDRLLVCNPEDCAAIYRGEVG
ncbi:MAG: beta-N-acetylhexosaminidase [Mariprofundales bacterium]